MQKQDRPVAFFDSGLGGISGLRETVRLLPQENYLYYGDSLHAPYGVKSEAQIQALSLAAAEHLVSAGAKAIVVACNTATSAAIGLLRHPGTDLFQCLFQRTAAAQHLHPGGGQLPHDALRQLTAALCLLSGFLFLIHSALCSYGVLSSMISHKITNIV